MSAPPCSKSPRLTNADKGLLRPIWQGVRRVLRQAGIVRRYNEYELNALAYAMYSGVLKGRAAAVKGYERAIGPMDSGSPNATGETQAARASVYRRKDAPDENQKGWGPGGMSERARQAIDEGKRTADMIAKDYGLKAATVEKFLNTREWHHVQGVNKTPDVVKFYDFDPKNDVVDRSRLAEMKAHEQGRNTAALEKRTRTLVVKKLGLTVEHDKLGETHIRNGDKSVGTFRGWGFDASRSQDPEAARRVGDAFGLSEHGKEKGMYVRRKEGDFGPIFDEYKHDAQGAVDRLMQEKRGEAVAALHHPQLGDIDLVWGETGPEGKGYGLEKIADRHPEVLHDLQGLISGMNISKKGEGTVVLESANHISVVKLNWLGKEKRWLLTAYEKKTSPGVGGTIGFSKRPEGPTEAPQSPGDKGSIPPSPPDGNPPGGMRFSTARRVTPEQDRAFADAEARGDTETGQRMADKAARRNGHTTPAYHAGTVEDRFDQKYVGTGLVGSRSSYTFFGSNKDAVDYYAEPESGRNTKKYYLNTKDFVEFDGGIPRENADNAFMDAHENGSEFVGAVTRSIVDGDMPMDVYAVPFNEDGTTTAAKLADPFTYDDAGKLIPLSERFNTQNPDIRYSTAPDPGNVTRAAKAALRSEDRVGRPDLANAGLNDEARRGMRVADEYTYRNPESRPDAEVRVEADTLDREEVRRRIRDGHTLTDAETLLGHEIITEAMSRAMQAGNLDQMREAVRLAHGWREGGRDLARSMRMRADRMQSPEDRFLAAFGTAMTAPTGGISKRMAAIQEKLKGDLSEAERARLNKALDVLIGRLALENAKIRLRLARNGILISDLRRQLREAKTPVVARFPNHDTLSTEGLLLPCPEDLRSAEWHGRETMPQQGSSRGVGASAGKRLEAASTLDAASCRALSTCCDGAMAKGGWGPPPPCAHRLRCWS